MAAAVSLTAGVAGCTGEGSCRTVFDGTERVETNSWRRYEVDTKVGERLYIELRRLSGPRPTLIVLDPDKEPLVELSRVGQLERIVEITETGRYTVVIRNDSTASSGRWKTTVAAYRGWCSDVF
jgi:hypothetical protein